MGEIRKILGSIFITVSVIFLLADSFIVTVTSGESFSRDLFGFVVPNPPTWTSFIPYMGYFVDFLYQFISIHGLVQLVIFSVILGIGILLKDKNC